nr:hypothetical protein [Candidatus Sigynarchaeota archaeon]
MTPLEELVEYGILDDEKEREAFKALQGELWNTIKVEVEATGETWQEAHFWFVDRLVYTFLNRLFAIRVMEALDLLKESTLVPQADLGNRAARLARIQEKQPGKTMFEWLQLVLRDAFDEIGKEVRILFDESDVASHIWPGGQVIEQLVQKINTVSPDIYKKSDIIGWFYHYYVLKARKGHKTMSGKGRGSPSNPNYLSILNTVYTPRWMVRVLVDNSLGHWWQDTSPNSEIFSQSPFFIKKIPVQLDFPTKDITKLRILDPACGSGNFLVYTFEKLVDMYKETHPDWQYSRIVRSILLNNIFGIDINRRPAQLSALALYISARNVIKTRAPAELATFKMPPVNIICCDIRIPHDKNRVLFIQQIKDPRIQKIMKDVVEQFDNADQLGSLIDIQGLQAEMNKIKLEKRIESKKAPKLDAFMPNGKNTSPDDEAALDLVSIIESEVLAGQQGNIGMQLFGRQAKNAASLAQVLMRKYDIIMGNPPFGLSMDATKQKFRKFYPNTYGDLISTFVDQSVRLLKVNGHITMVTDFSFLHLPKFEKFRSEILLRQSFIEYLLMIGYGSLPDAGNRPVLFILRKNNEESKNIAGYYRYPQYDINKSFSTEHYIAEIFKDVQNINSWSGEGKLPRGWNRIDQADFLSLPRFVIDLSIAEKFKPLLEFFTKYQILDINQNQKNENDQLERIQIGRAFQGIATGNNDIFVRLSHEVHQRYIRKVESINEINEVPNNNEFPFVPFSKGGGDIRYYFSNGFLIWWNAESIKVIKSVNGVIRNPDLIGKSEIIWSRFSGKPRGRFCICQNSTMCDVASMSIRIIEKSVNPQTLIAYLNSKIGMFFGRLQTLKRAWECGIIARFPIPLRFLEEKSLLLSTLSKESFQLRRDWDTGYPMSPIFAESLVDKVIKNNSTINDKGFPKTGHPFCQEYIPCNSETTRVINSRDLEGKSATSKKLLDLVEHRFDLLTQRLDEIDDEINKILYEGLLDTETSKALDEYYDTFVGKLGWQAERDIWLKDFILAGLMNVTKAIPKGIIPLNTTKADELGLYDRLITLLCKKFDRDIHGIQPILKELEELLGKDVKHWITDDFFFYHCQRFGGRPIIWQFSSRSKSGKENALDLFVDYHKITENTLPNIRVEYIAPLLRSLEQQKVIGTLSKEDVPRIDELEDFSKVFAALEAGYAAIPNPNALTGKNAQKGKGDDQTWEWVFGEAAKVIKNGYKPDHFLGVLVNIIPLCFDLPEIKQKDFPVKYHAICPKGTLKHVLKKLDALDQLRNVGSKDESDDDDNDEEQGESKKPKRKRQDDGSEEADDGSNGEDDTVEAAGEDQ